MILKDTKCCCAPNVGTFGSFSARSFGLQAVAATPTPSPTPTSTPTRTPTPTPCPSNGTFLYSYCSGYDLYYVYANGSCGSYSQLAQSNSFSCGFPTPSPTPTSTPTRTPTPTPCPSYGTFLYYTGACSGTRYQTSQILANGSCGTYSELFTDYYNSNYCNGSSYYVGFGLATDNGNHYYSLGTATQPNQYGPTIGPGYGNLQFFEGGSHKGKITLLQPQWNPLFIIEGYHANYLSFSFVLNLGVDGGTFTFFGGHYGSYLNLFYRYPSLGSGGQYIDIGYDPF